jgi:N-acetylneuraminate synthase
MRKTVKIAKRLIGDGYPVYIVAEIGINHNGDITIAKKLIDAAVSAGCDAVKFQKRTPELCVPLEQRQVKRETPWGYITYMEYRHKVEFGLREYKEIDHYCKDRGITWFVSCWDEPSLDFMQFFDISAYKIPSASLTDKNLLEHYKKTGKVRILSTGMSTREQIMEAVDILGKNNLILTHSTSTYPCPVEELNLRVVETLRKEFNCPIGYSGHEVGLPTTVAAVALGACYVERHITLDRSMWGSDQVASVEPGGMERLVKYIRIVEQGMGDGIKRVYDSEKNVMKRLRRIINQ